MPEITFRLVTAGLHFLYLPIYYAAHKDFFGLLPEGYQIEVDAGTSRSRSDRTTFKMLVNRDYAGFDNVAFAACDPAMLLEVSQQWHVHPIVACGLVTNTAFWAIDHETANAHTLSDLGVFKKIISFEAGTTGHRIAQHIRRVANENMQIETVAMGKEILALNRRAVGTLVLSPNLLELDEIVSNRAEFSFTFDLASTAEFSNVVITALITRLEITTQHPRLIKAIIGALAISMSRVRAEDPDVLKYASDKFGCTVERAKSALKRGNRSQIFPAGLELTLPQWQNAANAYFETKGLAVTSDLKTKSIALYNSHIGPYVDDTRQVAAEAISEHYAARPRAEGASKSTNAPTLSLYLIGLILAAGAIISPKLAAETYYFYSLQIVAILAFCGLADGLFAVGLAHLETLRKKPRYFRKVNILLAFVASSTGALWATGLVSWPLASTLLAGIWALYFKACWEIFFKSEKGNN